MKGDGGRPCRWAFQTGGSLACFFVHQHHRGLVLGTRGSFGKRDHDVDAGMLRIVLDARFRKGRLGFEIVLRQCTLLLRRHMSNTPARIGPATEKLYTILPHVCCRSIQGEGGRGKSVWVGSTLRTHLMLALES